MTSESGHPALHHRGQDLGARAEAAGSHRAATYLHSLRQLSGFSLSDIDSSDIIDVRKVGQERDPR